MVLNISRRKEKKSRHDISRKQRFKQQKKKFNKIEKITGSYSDRFSSDIVYGYNEQHTFDFVTNFDEKELDIYRLAITTYRNEKYPHISFGISDIGEVYDDETGYVRKYPTLRGLYIRNYGCDLSEFWEHLNTIQRDSR